MAVSSQTGLDEGSAGAAYQDEGSVNTEAGSSLHTPFWHVKRWPQPYRFGLLLVGTVFIGEALIMIALAIAPPMHVWVHTILDASLITVILIPPLYFWMLRPLVSEVQQRRVVQKQIEKRNTELQAVTRSEQHQRQLAEALTQATVALNSSLDLDIVLDRILEQTQSMVPCPVIAILRIEDDWVDVPRHRGIADDHPLNSGFPLSMFAAFEAAAVSSEPLLATDTERTLAWQTIPGLEWVRSFVIAPLVVEQRTIGFLATLSDEPDFFPSDVIDLLVSFATYASMAIHHASLYRSEIRARSTAETLSAASLALTETLDLETVLEVLLRTLHRLIPCGVGTVLLLEGESRVTAYARVFFDEYADRNSLVPDTIDLLDHPDCRRILENQKAILVHCAEEMTPWRSQTDLDPDTRCVAVPIVAGGSSLGFCCLETMAAATFSNEQARLAEAVVRQASVAIQNAQLFRQVRAGHDRLRSLSRRLVEVQESERVHVARELHDEAGQMLSSMLLGFRMLEENASEPERVLEGVQELRAVAHTVQEDLNRLAMDLRPASLDYLGLVAALNTFVNKLRDQNGIIAQFKAVGWTEERLSREVEISVYRIAQEAMTNVVRHAHASHVDVLLQKNEASILLIVEDDGVGFDQEASSIHLGLVGIRERCEMLNGKVTVESTYGQGTTLVVEIPYGDTRTHLR